MIVEDSAETWVVWYGKELRENTTETKLRKMRCEMLH